MWALGIETEQDGSIKGVKSSRCPWDEAEDQDARVQEEGSEEPGRHGQGPQPRSCGGGGQVVHVARFCLGNRGLSPPLGLRPVGGEGHSC